MKWIQKSLSKSVKKKQILIERIKSAGKGELISHEEVMAYLDVMEEEVIAYNHAKPY